MMFESIREICLENAKEDPENAYNVTNNLNWLRYGSQVMKLATKLPRNAEVLDLGCGWGFIGPMLKEIRSDINITCSDIEMCDCWKQFRKYGVKYAYGDGTSMNIRSGAFDAIITFGVLEHVPPRSQNVFLQEVRRMLRRGGYLFIFNLPNKYSFPEFLAKHMGVWHHDLKYSMEDIKNLLDANRFDVIDSTIEFLIPAQIDRVSKGLAGVFNRSYHVINGVDRFLVWTPLKFFAQSIYIESRKGKGCSIS